MKPWVVINVEKNPLAFPMFRRRDGQSGVLYGNRTQETCLNNGEGLQRERAFVMFDDEGTADQYIEWYSKEYPSAVLVKAKSVSALYRDFGPVKTGVFTDKGMVPA